MDVPQIQLRLKGKGYSLTADGVLGAATYAALFSAVGGTKLCAMHHALGEAAAVHFSDHKVDTGLRLTNFLAQSCVETRGFTVLVENLNYSARRLTQVWPKRFPSLAAAAPFARNPEALAERVYGGRYGNVNAGDGWKYLGRGVKQTTFHDNYLQVEQITGLPVVAQPELLEQPDQGLLAGCIYWRERGCAEIADRDDIVALTKRINGGQNGLSERKAARFRAVQIVMGRAR